MSRFEMLLLGALSGAVAGGCHRLADETIDYEALRIDACESVCHTMDTCDPERFEGLEPKDCFERCMTLMPRLHEENQCGSRQIVSLRCLGELSCEEFSAYEAGNNLAEGPPDMTAPCVAERYWAISCSTQGTFDIDEPVTTPPPP